MAASALKDRRAREAVLAWAEARGYQAGWQEESPLYRDPPASTDGVTGYAIWAVTVWAWRRLVQLPGPSSRRNRYVQPPSWMADATAPVLDDDLRSRLNSAAETTPKGRFRHRKPVDFERLMAVTWLRNVGGAGPWRIVAVAPDRFLGVFDRGWGRAVWVMAVPRTEAGAVWAISASESKCWPFATADAWAARHATIQWFGSVPAGVRQMIADAGPHTAAVASPKVLSIVGDRPSNLVVPVEGFERWFSFSSQVLAHVPRVPG